MAISLIGKQNISLGVIYGVISALSFSIMSVFVKKIGHDLPTSMLIFFRFGTSFLLLLPWIITDKSFSLKINQPIRYVVRIIAALLALFLVFYAIKFIPLVDALLLNNTAPLFVPMIAWFMTGAKMPRSAILGVLIGFMGIAIILNPGKEILSMISLIALASGFLAGVAIVQIRLISKTSRTKQILFYYFLVSTLISGIIAATQWHTPENLMTWGLLICIGIFGILYQVFATLSYVTAPVRLMSPLVFLMVVFGGLFDWLIWGNIPTWLTLLGFLCVMIGSVITIYFGQKTILIKKV